MEDTRVSKTKVWSKMKVILTVLTDHEGIVHHEYTPSGQTVNKEYYIEVLCQLNDVIQCQ